MPTKSEMFGNERWNVGLEIKSIKKTVNKNRLQITYKKTEKNGYNQTMKIEFDPEKNNQNIVERDLSFELAKEFDFETAQLIIDNRKDYGEVRIRAFGFF